VHQQLTAPSLRAQASPFSAAAGAGNRVPYSVEVAVWSSLDGGFTPITILMEVVPDAISNLSRVDTAVTATLADTDPSTGGASVDGASTSGDDVVWFLHAMDQYGNALDAVEQQPVLDVFRVDAAGPAVQQSFQQQNLMRVDAAEGGYHGLFRGAVPRKVDSKGLRWLSALRS
jgi:hypothetical protein